MDFLSRKDIRQIFWLITHKQKKLRWDSFSDMIYFNCHRVKEQRNILHEIRQRKANWIGHILLRNCLLQRVIEGKIKGGIEVTGRRGRKRRKLLDDLKERRGYSHLKEEALDRTMWRARFGRDLGPVVRQTNNEWMNEMRAESLFCLALKRYVSSRCIALNLWQLFNRFFRIYLNYLQLWM
jgi:hypothetical protein